LSFCLPFLIETPSVFLLASFHFHAALFFLLPPQICLSLLVGAALLILALAFRLALLFPLLAALRILRLPFAVSPLLLSLAALLIVVVLLLVLLLVLRLLLVVVLSFVTASPVILSIHQDGRAQAERQHQQETTCQKFFHG